MLFISVGHVTGGDKYREQEGQRPIATHVTLLLQETYSIEGNRNKLPEI